MINNLTIDKQTDHIAFNEAEHIYWNVNTGERYASVTGLIKKYCNPFDKDSFSRYKAIERIKGAGFAEYKRNKGGVAGVIKHYVNTDDLELLCFVQGQILIEWRKNGDQAMQNGTKEHKVRENELLAGKPFIFNNTAYHYKPGQKIDTCYRGAFPELLVYSDRYKLAGQVDLTLVDNTFWGVLDYKTTKDIKMENKYNKMLHPLTHLDDCKFNEYQLQISLYSYFIEMMYLTHVNRLEIIQIKEDGTDNFIPCSYLKKEVISILEERFLELEKNKLQAQTAIKKINIKAQAIQEELFPI